MAKTGKRHLSLVILLGLFSSVGSSQAKTGMESYNYLSNTREYQWMPVVHYQSAKGLYAEMRYNYEEKNTVSIYGGRTWSTGDKLVFDITPMIGFSWGDFKGASLATNISLEYGHWYLSSQSQYSRSFKVSANHFFFSWSEIGYGVLPNFFAGIAGQFTGYSDGMEWEPGLLVGLTFGKLSIPVYFFRPFNAGRNVLIGLSYEYQLKKRKKQSKSMSLD